jgi:ABC-type sugar transport system ATPase subunit
MIQKTNSNIVPLLKMEKIVKAFSGTLAVNKMDFVCKSGEIHGLVGENGAGKSTLMKILGNYSFYRYSDGRLYSDCLFRYRG